ncbi:MAG: nitroreductase family protein [Chloroflexota bacterium]
MISVKEAIETRRSIRHFQALDVPDDMIREMLEAARLAPSAMNLQPWFFIVTRDQEKKGELARICWGQKSIAEAPVDIVCFADRSMYSREERDKRRQESAAARTGTATASTSSGRSADTKFREYLKSFPTPPMQETLPSMVSNTFIAITQMILMATGLGLATVWVGGFTEWQLLNKLFDLGDNMMPIAVIPVGYAAETPRPRVRRPISEIARWV